MCCHTFHCRPPALSCSVLLPCYLGLEIKRLSCCCHDVCLQGLNAPVSWCLHLTTSWQLPNKTERNQATTVMMTNHFAEQCEEKKGMALWLWVFLLTKWHRHTEGTDYHCSWLTHAALLLWAFRKGTDVDEIKTKKKKIELLREMCVEAKKPSWSLFSTFPRSSRSCEFHKMLRNVNVHQSPNGL